MALVFWDARRVKMMDYLSKRRNNKISSLLHRFLEEIKENRPGSLRQKVLFHQDNARVYMSVESTAQIHDSGFKLLPHPAYLPDLATSDFRLFLNNNKKHLGSQKFSSNKEVEDGLNLYFADL